LGGTGFEPVTAGV